MRFDPRDGGSSQIAVTRVISGDEAFTTSRDSNVTHTTLTSEEAEGTCGRVSVVVLESIGSSVPVDEGSIETAVSTTVCQTDEVVAQSSIFRVVTVGQMSFSPGDSFTTVSGVGETMRAVTTRRWGSSTTGITSSTGVDVSTTGISSASNMVPSVGGTRKTRNIFTGSLAINVEFSTRAERSNQSGVGSGGRTDIKGRGSSVGSCGATTSWGTLTTGSSESTTDVSSLGRNVVPGVGSAGKTRYSVTTDLTINIELGVCGDSCNNVGVGIGTRSDVKRFATSVNSGSEAHN